MTFNAPISFPFSFSPSSNRARVQHFAQLGKIPEPNYYIIKVKATKAPEFGAKLTSVKEVTSTKRDMRARFKSNKNESFGWTRGG